MIVRVNISLSPELVAELRQSKLNRSAVCETALWAALKGDSHLRDLTEENDRLHKMIDAIRAVVS